MDNGLQLRCFGCGYPLQGLESTRCPECGRNISPGEQIASYRENSLLVGCRRDFHLYPDKIVVKVRWRLQGAAETPIPLTSLHPDPLKLSQRSALFPAGSANFCAGGVFATLLFLIGYVITGHDFVPFGALAVGAIVLGMGYLLAMASAPWIEYVRFRDVHRADVCLLDVGRIGPDVARMDDFISALKQQIQLARDEAVRVSKPANAEASMPSSVQTAPTVVEAEATVRAPGL